MGGEGGTGREGVEGRRVNKRAGLQEEGQRLYRTTMKVRFNWYISQRKGMRNQTCPIPPEAPRTAIFKGHGVSNESYFIKSGRGGECLPALTMMDDVLGYSIQIGSCFENEKLVRDGREGGSMVEERKEMGGKRRRVRGRKLI